MNDHPVRVEEALKLTAIALLLFLSGCYGPRVGINPHACEYLTDGPFAGKLLCTVDERPGQ